MAHKDKATNRFSLHMVVNGLHGWPLYWGFKYHWCMYAIEKNPQSC